MTELTLYEFYRSIEATRFAGLRPVDRGVYYKAVVALTRAGYRSVEAVAEADDDELLARCHSFGPTLLAYTRELIPSHGGDER